MTLLQKSHLRIPASDASARPTVNFAMRKPAPAKINLYLHVTGARPDGYHLLDSMLSFTGLIDIIEVAEHPELSLLTTGNFAENLHNDADHNLAMRAARLLQEQQQWRLGAGLVLTKNIPVSAGLGGGSADAAATLRLLNEYWGLHLEDEALLHLAAQLGADVPACLVGRSCYVSGIGEVITPIEVMPKLNVLLVNPMKPLATKEVFARGFTQYRKPIKRPDGFDSVSDLLDFLSLQHNDLEQNAISMMPEIEGILSSLRAQKGCKLARLSGSGPTCFGLFTDKVEAENARAAIFEDNPKWWVRLTMMRG